MLMETIQTERKECTDCGELKELNEFYSQKHKKKDGSERIYYNPECKECTKKRTNKWRKKNPEKVAIANKKLSPLRNKIKRENKEKYREHTRNWQRNNPEKLKEFNAYRQQHKKHKISNNEWEACKNYFNYRCCYCGLPIEEHYIMYRGKTQLGDFHKEHADDNGSNDLSNCIPSCKSCNSSKRQSTFEGWFNENNPNFTFERLNKINQWLEEDYKKYIKKKS
jgi:hypothetical protein